MRKYCRKRVTAVGVLDSGLLPPKKAQILMKNQFERNTIKTFFFKNGFTQKYDGTPFLRRLAGSRSLTNILGNRYFLTRQGFVWPLA